MKKNKLHPAAELAAYKTGILRPESAAEDEEKYIRLAAEFDNFRKRSSRQYAQLIKSANEELILEILDVVDDFQRALETMSSSESEARLEDCENVLSGMKLIYEKLISVLKNRGVRAIEALNKPFDPNYHEAVMQSPSKDHEAGTVINVVSPGYMLDDKVIRHSKVVVAS
ncbi:MAG: nucleotide exchange factor GrpE [Candidatus Zixiibacteriota bacterium]|nr:MAG: nucleotide exchange factor GrpE [candidate division Zixibacteria bacterium]